MLIFDNHVHLRPDGRNIEAVREFSKAGGTHLVICHMPYDDLPVSREEDFKRSYERTLRMAETVSERTGVKAYTTLGPYPVELLSLLEKSSLEDAKRIMLYGLDLAAKLVAEGKALAIGEIGRPHFPVDQDIWLASNEILSHGMCLARDVGCPVVVHSETATLAVFGELARMADEAGLRREKVVKHYSPPIVREGENCGIFPSVIASEKNIVASISQGNRFLMETDYLDDPKRPGAVMGIATVPRKTKKLLQAGTLTLEDVHVIHVENPRKVYGIEVE